MIIVYNINCHVPGQEVCTLSSLVAVIFEPTCAYEQWALMQLPEGELYVSVKLDFFFRSCSPSLVGLLETPLL